MSANNHQAKLDALRMWKPEKLRSRLPAWAKQSGFPVAPFKPDLRQFIPRGPVTILGNEQHRAWVFERFLCQPIDKMTPQQYVEAFDLANGFRPAPVQWITPTLGNWT